MFYFEISRAHKKNISPVTILPDHKHPDHHVRKKVLAYHSVAFETVESVAALLLFAAAEQALVVRALFRHFLVPKVSGEGRKKVESSQVDTST